MAPTFIRQDDRGSFVEAVNHGPWETVIFGEMRPGSVLGNHYHRVTRALLFVQSGSAVATLVDVPTGRVDRVRVAAGQGVRLEPMSAHAIRFEEESRFLLLKSRAYDPRDPDTFEFPVPVGG